MIILSLFISVVALAFGSFLGTCAYRIPYGVSLTGSRSFCPRCHRGLRWYELIPVISYVRSHGKCCSCRARISAVYPLIETLAGMVAVEFFLQYGLAPEFIIATAFSFFMLLIAVIDWKHLVIPNKIIFAGFITLGILQTLFFGFTYFLQSLFFACIAGLLVLAVLLIGNRFYRKETMGMGDVKLSALIGFCIGLSGFLITFWFAALVGSLVGITKIVLRGHPKDTRLPLGSFLAISTILYLLFQTPIQNWMELWLISMR